MTEGSQAFERLYDMLPGEDRKIARRLRTPISSWAAGVVWVQVSLNDPPDSPEYAFGLEDYEATLDSRSSLERAVASIWSWDSALGRQIQVQMDELFRAVTESDPDLLRRADLAWPPGKGGWWSDRVPLRGAVRLLLEQKAARDE
jgi:hypothetical protein